jgi:hypothetical protein
VSKPEIVAKAERDHHGVTLVRLFVDGKQQLAFGVLDDERLVLVRAMLPKNVILARWADEDEPGDRIKEV